MHAAYIGLSLFILWQAHVLLSSPSCIYCGRKVEHARDCPERSK